jgi:hypothetical protein
MSQSYEYILPKFSKDNEIALDQTPVNEAYLKLNGTNASPLTGTASFNYSFIVGIFSFDDLTGIDFIVTGTQNGVAIEDTIVGTAAEISVGNMYFDTINTIKVVGVVGLGIIVSAGTSGTVGYLPAILINTEKKFNDLGYALQIIGSMGSEAIIYISLMDITNSGKTYEQLVLDSELFPIDVPAAGVVTLPNIVQMKNICKTIVVKITNNVDEQVTMQFLQL